MRRIAVIALTLLNICLLMNNDKLNNINNSSDFDEKKDDTSRTESDEVIKMEIQIKKDPLAAWFLGPKAEHGDVWTEMLNYIFQDYIHWRRNYFPEDPVIVDRIKRREHEHWFDKLNTQVDTILNQLKAHFPFYSPRYIAHMLSEQTLPSVLGYFAGMLYNPNNVTDEAAPVTVPLEIEVGKMISKMLGYNPVTSWSHICSGGTIANTEALWVARASQFNGLVIKEFCLAENLDFKVELPNGKEKEIRLLKNRQLLHLNPTVSVRLFRLIQKYFISKKLNFKTYTEKLNEHLKNSKYNINNVGLSTIINEIKLKPKIFVSEAAHYCIKKAANILGYGEVSIELIPVDENFRINTTILETKLKTLGKNEYIAAVIGIVGSTEEGAVDSIYDIKFIRDRLSKEKNISFWLHIDAAWGGYIRSLFVGHSFPKKKDKQDINIICSEYEKKMKIEEAVELLDPNENLKKKLKVKWNDYNLYRSFLAMPNAESITIDPHKLGYIPYPAGVINFKNAEVTFLIKQEAQYISNEQKELSPYLLEKELDKPIEINAIGPYIMEGSKPGAAAAACWLAHKTIPLEIRGHGKIIRTTLLNTKKLIKYLTYHKILFKSIDEELFGRLNKCPFPFSFIPIYEPDSNVICFIVHPMVWQNQKLEMVDVDLTKLNCINQDIYSHLTIKNTTKHIHTPYAQDYFVSRTWIRNNQYNYYSIKAILDRLNINKTDYEQTGLFILRSTVMNPWHYHAEQVGKNYLFDFIKALHKYSRMSIEAINSKINNGN